MPINGFWDLDFLEKQYKALLWLSREPIASTLMEPSASELHELGNRQYRNMSDEKRARLYFELAAEEDYADVPNAVLHFCPTMATIEPIDISPRPDLIWN